MPEHQLPPHSQSDDNKGCSKAFAGHALDTKSSIVFDWEEWRPYLEDADIPDEQKQELAETLFGVVFAFVDLGWEIDFAGLSDGPVDRLPEKTNLRAELQSVMVQLENKDNEKTRSTKKERFKEKII